MTSCRQGWEARFTPAQITLATLMRHQPPHHCTRHRHIALTPHSKHMVRKLQALLCFTLVGCQREDAGCFALVLVRMLGAFFSDGCHGEDADCFMSVGSHGQDTRCFALLVDIARMQFFFFFFGGGCPCWLPCREYWVFLPLLVVMVTMLVVLFLFVVMTTVLDALFCWSSW